MVLTGEFVCVHARASSFSWHVNLRIVNHAVAFFPPLSAVVNLVPGRGLWGIPPLTPFLSVPKELRRSR